MKKPRKDYGTDPRFPVWSGGTVAGNFFRGGMTVAILVNWFAFYALFTNVLAGYPKIVWDGASVFWAALALGTCLATTQLINHEDEFTRNVGRSISCGTPFVLMLFMFIDSLTI